MARTIRSARSSQHPTGASGARWDGYPVQGGTGAAARDAAARALLALEGPGDAAAAEEADWDLDKAVASIGDVRKRLPSGDAEAESIHLAFGAARESLARAVAALEAGADARSSPEARAATSALREAAGLADAYLEGHTR